MQQVRQISNQHGMSEPPAPVAPNPGITQIALRDTPLVTEPVVPAANVTIPEAFKSPPVDVPVAPPVADKPVAVLPDIDKPVVSAPMPVMDTTPPKTAASLSVRQTKQVATLAELFDEQVMTAKDPASAAHIVQMLLSGNTPRKVRQAFEDGLKTSHPDVHGVLYPAKFAPHVEVEVAPTVSTPATDTPAASIKADKPVVTREHDFAKHGTYHVKMPDGHEYRIFRDTDQFSYPVWHVDPPPGVQSGLHGIGYTKQEAIEALRSQHNQKYAHVKPTASTPSDPVSMMMDAVKSAGSRNIQSAFDAGHVATMEYVTKGGSHETRVLQKADEWVPFKLGLLDDGSQLTKVTVGKPTTPSVAAKPTSNEWQTPALSTENATVVRAYAGNREGFAIKTQHGAEVSGYTHNADFPGEGGDPKRGELFLVKVPEAIRKQGIGRSLSDDALKVMRAAGAERVNIATTSSEGRALVSAMLRDGSISGPVKTSATGKAEYHIGRVAAKPETVVGKPASGLSAGANATPLYEAHGDENMVARVFKHDNGYAVSMLDNEAGKTVNQIRIFPTLDGARAHANTIKVATKVTDVTPKGYGPVAETPGSLPTSPLDVHLGTEAGKLRASINEANTILKGNVSGAQRSAIERTRDNAQAKLSEMENGTRAPSADEIDKPYVAKPTSGVSAGATATVTPRNTEEHLGSIPDGSEITVKMNDGTEHVGVLKRTGNMPFIDRKGDDPLVLKKGMDLDNVNSVTASRTADEVIAAKDARKYGTAAYEQPKSRDEYESTLWGLAKQIEHAKNNKSGPTDQRAMQLESQFHKVADEIGLAQTKRKYMLVAGRNGAPSTMPHPQSLYASPLDAQALKIPKPTDFHPDVKERQKRSLGNLLSYDTKGSIEYSLRDAKSKLANKPMSASRRQKFQNIVRKREKQLASGNFREAKAALLDKAAGKKSVPVSVAPAGARTTKATGIKVAAVKESIADRIERSNTELASLLDQSKSTDPAITSHGRAGRSLRIGKLSKFIRENLAHDRRVAHYDDMPVDEAIAKARTELKTVRDDMLHERSVADGNKTLRGDIAQANYNSFHERAELVNAKLSQLLGKKNGVSATPTEDAYARGANAVAKTGEKPDQAVVNVPISKRGNLDTQIDAAKKATESGATTQSPVKLHAHAQDVFDAHKPILESMVAKEAAPHRKAAAADSVLHNIQPDAQRALVDHLKAFDNEAYQALAAKHSVGLSNLFPKSGTTKVVAPAVKGQATESVSGATGTIKAIENKPSPQKFSEYNPSSKTEGGWQVSDEVGGHAIAKADTPAAASAAPKPTFQEAGANWSELGEEFDRQDMVELIDKNSPGVALNFRALRKVLADKYVLSRVRVDELKFEKGTEELVNPDKAHPEKGAIVIGKDGLVADGRHRGLLARRNGQEFIEAYVPKPTAAETGAKGKQPADAPVAKEPWEMGEAEFGEQERQALLVSLREDLRKAKSGEEIPGIFNNGAKSKAALVRLREKNLADALAAKPETYSGDHLGHINKAIRDGEDVPGFNLRRYGLDAVADLPPIGEIVKLTKPGVGGPINIAGTVKKHLDDGRIEVRTQEGEIRQIAPSELGHKPKVGTALNPKEAELPFDLESARVGMDKRGYAEYGEHKVKVVPHPNGGADDKATFAVQHLLSDGKGGANRTILPTEYKSIEEAQNAALNELNARVGGKAAATAAPVASPESVIPKYTRQGVKESPSDRESRRVQIADLENRLRPLEKKYSDVSSKEAKTPRGHTKIKAKLRQEADSLGTQVGELRNAQRKLTREQDLQMIEDSLENPKSHEHYLKSLAEFHDQKRHDYREMTDSRQKSYALGRDGAESAVRNAEKHSLESDKYSNELIDRIKAKLPADKLNKDELQSAAEDVYRDFGDKTDLNRSIEASVARRLEARKDYRNSEIDLMTFLDDTQRAELKSAMTKAKEDGGPEWNARLDPIIQKGRTANAEASDANSVRVKADSEADAKQAEIDAGNAPKESRAKNAVELSGTRYIQIVNKRAKKLKGTVEKITAKGVVTETTERVLERETISPTWEIVKRIETIKDGKKAGEMKTVFDLVHSPTGLNVTTANKKNQAKQLLTLIEDQGIDLSTYTDTKKIPSEIVQKFSRISRAWEDDDLGHLNADEQITAMSRVPKPEHGLKADMILGADDMGYGVKENVRVKSAKINEKISDLAREVPEFAYNPVLTVTDDKRLLFRNGYRYEFSPEAFNLHPSELTPGKTIGINLADMGIARASEHDVVVESLKHAGFESVKKSSAGKITAIKRNGGEPTVVSQSKPEQWKATGVESKPVQELLDKIRWFQPSL